MCSCVDTVFFPYSWPFTHKRMPPIMFLSYYVPTALHNGKGPKHHYNTALVDTVTKGSAGICDLLEIETRESFPYTNCIIQLIISSSSGSWSCIAGSQQFNIKTCVFASTVILAFIGLTDGAASCYYPCAYIDNPVCCTDGVIMRFSNNCETKV